MEGKVSGRYLISALHADEKAALLQELSGGKNALRYNQALEAVAIGCGFDEWRELAAVIAKLEAGEANSLGISPLMLADDQHVDEETLAVRRANQLTAVRGSVTCSFARAQELVTQWALSGSAPPPSGESEEDSGSSSASSDTSPSEIKDERVDDESREQSVPATPVAVSYKKRRVVTSR